MHIIHIGQYGINYGSVQSSALATRAFSLAKEFASLGHEVTYLSPEKTSLREVHGVKLLYTPSFHPEHPGGFLYSLLSLLKAKNLHPSVIHIHTWAAACLIRLIALLIPETTFIWTVSQLPKQHPLFSRFIAWQARGVFDAIIAPTREIQYHLLTTYSLRSTYIPDGHDFSPTLYDIPTSFFGLRKGQYAVTLAQDPKHLLPLLSAYEQTKTKKKLVAVVFGDKPAWQKKLQKKYPFLVVMPVISHRPLFSLIRQSAVFIANETTDTSVLLSAMESGRAIVATNYPIHQEVLGTAAQFVKVGDIEGLTESMGNVIFYPSVQEQWGKKASSRARRHFDMRRIMEEYDVLYHYPRIVRVPMDSVVAGTWKQSPV